MAKSRGRTTARPTSGDDAKDPLEVYRDKRDFSVTSEPKGEVREAGGVFVVQKHDATRLHYDVRLEIDGTMMSFAVPKGPSYDPETKRLAVEVEDHPIEYNQFEGRIPDGQYGAGDVLVWDEGSFETVPPGKAAWMRDKGHLHVRLKGKKLEGEWHFVRIAHEKPGPKCPWLMFKAKDRFADPKRDIVTERPESIVSGRSATRGPRRTTSSAEGASARSLLDAVGEVAKATAVSIVDDPTQYVFEIKYDGYRILAAKSGDAVRLESRNGHHWTDRFRVVADAIAKLPVREAVLDGEVCAVDENGTPSFRMLQQWLAGERGAAQIAFGLFDLLWLDGRDLRARPLEERRELLEALLRDAPPPLSFSRAIEVPRDGTGRPDVGALLAMIRSAGLEGVVGKRKGYPYVGGRTAHWIKLKILRRQDFAICGYVPIKGTKSSVAGSLLLAMRDTDGSLRFAGKVGSGLDDKTRIELARTLDRERVPEPTVTEPERVPGARWAKPRLVVEVQFMEWVDEWRPRFPTFVALREDKTPDECFREVPLEANRALDASERDDDPPPPSVPVSSRQGGPVSLRGARRVLLSNPDKVLFPRDGIRKRDVVQYFDAVAPAMMPHLAGRPINLQRWPDGIDGEAWFQHHPPQGTPDWVRVVEHDGKTHMIADEVDTVRWLGNLAALTFHQWSSHAPPSPCSPAEVHAALDVPDYVVIDLDPGEQPWSGVIEVACALRVLLEQLELPSHPKTSGKRGLHVFIPFKPGPTHVEAVRLGELLANAVAKVLPNVASVERVVKKRGGRLYVDYLQNGVGRTVVAPYSIRALDGAPVSTPLLWSEVTVALDPMQHTIRTVPDRLQRHGDLFAGVLRPTVDVLSLLKRLG